MEDIGIRVSELKEQIVSEGMDIRDKSLKLLKDCRALRLGLWNSMSRTTLRSLEGRYDGFYIDFMKYDNLVSSYIGMAHRPMQCGDGPVPQYQTMEANRDLIIFSDHLSDQREAIRPVLNDLGNLL